MGNRYDPRNSPSYENRDGSASKLSTPSLKGLLRHTNQRANRVRSVKKILRPCHNPGANRRAGVVGRITPHIRSTATGG